MLKYERELNQPTLLQWCKAHMGGPYLVEVTKHFVAVRGCKVVDTRNREPIPIEQFHGRRRRVQRFIRFEKIKG
jgi:hypothetical protein